jgi:hypothetical protein
MNLKKLSMLFLFLTVMMPVMSEQLKYNLSVSVGFINIGIGESSMSDNVVIYNGESVRRLQMTMTSGKTADGLYRIRDTITSYNSLDGKSLFYCKVTNENNRNDRETALFSCEEGVYKVELVARSIDGRLLDHNIVKERERIYDMLNMLQFTRKMDSHNLKKGDSVTLQMVNGTLVVKQYIVYEGDKTIKADDGKSYECHVISIRDRKYGDERETLKAFVTKDQAHIPVQLNIKLSLGYIKALLK